MRYAAVAVSILLWSVGSLAHAQDDGGAAAAAAAAAATAAAQAQQANQQAMEFARQAAQQASQNLTDASNNANDPPAVYVTRSPDFSVKHGSYPAAITVRLHSPTHHATIFYTTDGWTPTTSSTLYTGPIPVTADTMLQAIAVAPGYRSSVVSAAQYRIAASSSLPSTDSTAKTPLTLPETLLAGTPVQVRFPQQLSSETAYVGQPLQLALARDLVVDGHLIAPAGTPANAVVTEADHTGRVYQAGVISFALKSMVIHGVTVPLAGTRTLEGTPVSAGRAALFLIPVAGPLTVLKHGQRAEIPAGAEMQGNIAETAVIPPAVALP